MMGTERDRLKRAIEHDNSSPSQGAIAALNKSLMEVSVTNLILVYHVLSFTSLPHLFETVIPQEVVMGISLVLIRTTQVTSNHK